MCDSKWKILMVLMIGLFSPLASAGLRQIIEQRDPTASKRIAEYLGKPDFDKSDELVGFGNPNAIHIFAQKDWRPGQPMIFFIATVDLVKQGNTTLLVVYADKSAKGAEQWRANAEAAAGKLNGATVPSLEPHNISDVLGPVLSGQKYHFASLYVGRIGSQPKSLTPIIKQLVAKTAGWPEEKSSESVPELSVGSVIAWADILGTYSTPILAKGPHGYITFSYVGANGKPKNVRYIELTYGESLQNQLKENPVRRILKKPYDLLRDPFIAYDVISAAGDSNTTYYITSDGECFADFDGIIEVKEGQTFEEAIEQKKELVQHYRKIKPDWTYKVDTSRLGKSYNPKELIAMAEANLKETKKSCESALDPHNPDAANLVIR